MYGETRTGRGDDQDPEIVGRKQLVLPYDRATGRIQLLTRLEDIEMFDAQLAQVTEGLPLPLRIGSLLRVPSSAYGAFGIGLTDENQHVLKAAAEGAYRNDAAVGRPSKTSDNQWYATKKRLAADILTRLAGSAAGIVKEILLCIEGDRLRVLHLASGSGRLSSAVLSVLSSDTELLRRIILHLVDYSESALSSAKIQLNNYGVDIRTHTRDDEECLNDAIQRGHKYHVVMVSAHLHRKAFLDAYLGLLQQVLEPDGVLVITDLHSVLTHHPLHLVSLFEEHGIEGSRIDLLRELFGPLLAPGSCELTSQEIQSMTDHRTYLGRVVTEAKRYSGPKDHPVFVLGGFVSSRQLCTALDRAGMTTDVSEIAKAFPRARLPASLPVMLRAGSDSAAVTIATLRRVRA